MYAISVVGMWSRLPGRAHAVKYFVCTTQWKTAVYRHNRDMWSRLFG